MFFLGAFVGIISFCLIIFIIAYFKAHKTLWNNKKIKKEDKQ